MSGILVHSAFENFWMKISRRRALICLATFLVLLLAAFAGTAFLRVRDVLHQAQQGVAEENLLKFVSHSYAPPVDTGFESVSTPALFSQAAEFEGHLYVAGQAGLFEYDERGHELRDFRVGRELPPSPLLQIARATLADSQPELVIATADAGVLVFNGSQFRQILPQDREARSIASVLPLPSGRLLIGTSKRGVLVYDGHTLSGFHPALADAHVTELAGSDTDLWVGTQDRGVAHWHGGTADWFADDDGLPDPHVYSIRVAGQRTYVGTANGIAEFNDGKFVRVLAKGAFVRSLLVEDKTLLAGTMDDGVLEIALDQSSRRQSASTSIGDLTEVEQLFKSGDSTYALTRTAVFVRSGAANWNRALEPDSGLLTDSNISALAADPNARLWVGFFDRGLDIVESIDQEQRRRTRHLEDDRLFCVNRILLNAKADTTAVATANGLVFFDDQGIRRQVLTRADGLIADQVTDVVEYGDGMAVATPAGLTFIDSGGVRSIYAFHGLVNNHVYALAGNGQHLLAGTLGGVSLLDNDAVQASYTTATSTLKHNWITAALHVDDDWWVGTYGAGVMRMNDKLPGRFEAANGAGGDLVVNPGAMLATEHLILAGTMGKGLYAMDSNSEHWIAITDGLPSLNVTALAIANGYVYVGTDNGLVRIAERRLLQ